MKPVSVDENYLVSFYCFLVHTIADGISYSLGIIGTQLIQRRNYSRETAAWISTLLFTFFKCSAPVASALSNKYGCKFPVLLGATLSLPSFIITGLSHQQPALVLGCIGVWFGFCNSLLYMPTWIAANTYYKEKRQLANGIVMCGSSVGVAIFPPVVEWLMNEYGLQGTFMILGGVLFNLVVIAALMPPLENSESRQLLNQQEFELNSTDNDGTSKCSICKSLIAFDILKQGKYVIFLASSCFVDPTSIHTFYTYVPDYIFFIGYPLGLSWQPIAISGITNSLARFTTGFGNNSYKKTIIKYTISALLIGLTLMHFEFLPMKTHYWLLCVNSGLYGYGKGLFWSLKGPVLADIVPLKDFERALGTEQFFTGFFMLLCPLQGKLYDITGTYRWTFVTSGSQATMGGCLLCILVMLM